MTKRKAIEHARRLDPKATVNIMEAPMDDFADARLCAAPDGGQKLVFHPNTKDEDGVLICIDCRASSGNRTDG